ncbi:MCE family protein [Mycolicibacterium sphagni]|uniref:Mammalian cell entry protein n=1 Tax=Mycolicibacterium sphagni TaxID=1786 RepID=A0A255DHI0_9MYCO|nr:MCE family protein [Mycolicibacterium sphagni]OYN76695.1 mammalian cell entry protein [Mycolicibacterium sphagni]
MSELRPARRIVAVATAALITAGCGFHGLNSLPLPGTVGQGPGAEVYHVEIANVGTLESNSPVMINDVVVGSVGQMRFTNWHADVEVSLRPGSAVPANAVARVGQTSLLGSMHLALDPPAGQSPQGRLQPGSTLTLNQSSTYPSTEQTLSALSAVVNAGGLGQIGDIIHNFNAALSGREPQIRDLLSRLNDFIGTLARQRDNIIATINGLDRLSGTLAGQIADIDTALHKIPPALDVLIRERPKITDALDRLRVFSDTTTTLVNDTQADLVRNLTNLGPTIAALADVGPGLPRALAYLSAFPLGQDLIDRGVKGDYMNLFTILDLTVPRLKRSLFLGTRWGDANAQLVAAPGEPGYLNYTYNPLGVGVLPPDAPPPPSQPPSQAPAPPAIAPTDEGGH